MLACQIHDSFIEALTFIPVLKQVEWRLNKTWRDNPPVALVYATLGRTLAECFAELPQNHRLYVSGVIKAGLGLADVRKDLVRHALLGTLSARAKRLGPKRSSLICEYIEEGWAGVGS